MAGNGSKTLLSPCLSSILTAMADNLDGRERATDALIKRRVIRLLCFSRIVREKSDEHESAPYKRCGKRTNESFITGQSMITYLTTRRASRPGLWWGIAAALALLDQGLKFTIEHLYELGSSVAVSSFFNIVHARNTGASFSFLADAGGWQRYFFVVIALTVALTLIAVLRRDVPGAKPWAIVSSWVVPWEISSTGLSEALSWTIWIFTIKAGTGQRSMPRISPSWAGYRFY